MTTTPLSVTEPSTASEPSTATEQTAVQESLPPAHSDASDAQSQNWQPLTDVPGRVGGSDTPVLVVTPDAPIRKVLLERAQLSYLTLPDGARLRCAQFDHPEPVATVVIMTGYAEFIEKYYEVINELYDRRFSIVSFDWRGQGLSTRAHPRRCGWVAGYDQLIADLQFVIASLDRAKTFGPLLGLGHSMGGHLAIKLAQEHPQLLDGIVVTAPMMGLVTPKPPAMFRLTQFGNWLGMGQQCLPGNGVVDPFGPHVALSADPARIEVWRGYQRAEPYLITHGATWRWGLEAAQSILKICQPSAAEAVCTPLLIINPLGDTLVDPAATQNYAATCPAATLVDIPDAGHEILQEAPPLRSRFWREFDDFIADLI